MDLLNEKTKFVFDDEDWAILTLSEQRIPAFVYSSADVENSLISLGCKIKGTVEHSVLSANVIIEKNARVKDSIVFPDVIVEEGAKLEKVIVDTGVRVTGKKFEEIEKIRRKNKIDIIVVGKFKIQTESQIKNETA